MLKATGLSKFYGPRVVLNEVSLVLNTGERVCLVGANGVGKSTLLKILADVDSPDFGAVLVAPLTRIGYLPQNLPGFPDQTVEETILESLSEIRRLESRMRELEQEMLAAGSAALPRLLDEYGKVSTRFEERGGYSTNHRIDTVLAGLGIAYIERTRRLSAISGGEKARVGLAALLIGAPDLLLLDEPTNHLDRKSLEWLEMYLSSYHGATIIVSHDRQFVNRVATRILEIDEHSHRLTSYQGDYDAFKLAKEKAIAKWQDEYIRQQEEIAKLKTVANSAHSARRTRVARDGDKRIRHFKEERSQQAVSRTVRTAQERLQRILKEPIEKPPEPLRFRISFRSKRVRTSEIVSIVGVSKKFDNQHILRDINLQLGQGARVIVTGPNGSGKTTLLKIIVGELAADSGELHFAPNTRVGFLRQEPELPSADISIFDYYRQHLRGHEEDLLAGLMRSGFFRGDDLGKDVHQLSLGQVRKLEIACVVAEEPNVLVLDEPTNYISFDVLETLEVAINEFPGPVIAATHDRRFIQDIGGEILVLSPG